MDLRKPATFLGVVAVIFLMFDRGLRVQLGNLAGTLLEPVFGFHGQFPHLTILAVGSLTIVATTLIRHHTTDWIATARSQRRLRAWQNELNKAKRLRQTARTKALEMHQTEMLQIQHAASAKQFRTMPLTMAIVVPTFAWLSTFIRNVSNPYYQTPWNQNINLLDSTVFPHWVLLYMCLSIPLGALFGRALKAWSWRELPLTASHVEMIE